MTAKEIAWAVEREEKRHLDDQDDFAFVKGILMTLPLAVFAWIVGAAAVIWIIRIAR